MLGVAVGFGFASFESSGYALVALFGPHGLELHNMISTVLERGLLAPVGHGLWTGIVGGCPLHGCARWSAPARSQRRRGLPLRGALARAL
ncbi:MAG: PrsW family glutamic-type intramembrane protease [Solirubrobacteraceae bacterium]